MKLRLSEEQFLNAVQTNIDEEYPLNWNADEFAQLRSFNKRINYAQKNLKRISSGSSRIVYQIDDTKVLKLAKNKKGLAQNEVEIDFSEDYLFSMIVAEVYDYDPNFLWLEMELARKLTQNLFKKITGFSFKEFSDAIGYQYAIANPRKSWGRPRQPDNFDQMTEHHFIGNVIDIVGNYADMIIGDMQRLNSYGIVKRNGMDDVVMIDYGITGKVYDSFYR
jgi:mRNA-degrading endonuclease RelE of RelBE toxin-antitoxin system